MSEHRSPRDDAVHAVRQEVFEGHWDTRVEPAVDVVFEHLVEPDRDMLEAGIRELKLALPPGTKRVYQRDLARAIWCAMLERAR